MRDDAPLTFAVKDRRALGISESQARGWREDPRLFAREVCRLSPDKWQDRFFAALGGAHLDPTAQSRLALKACKGPGKTFSLAVAGWWWLFTRWHANGICTSITERNLEDGLWTELARVQQRSNVLMHFFAHRGERIEAKQHPKDWWLSKRSFPQNADKNQQAGTLAGLHGRFPIIILDEVGDYPEGVMQAAEGIFTEGPAHERRLCVAGNPTSVDGPLYRICTRDRKYWWVYEITGDPESEECASRINKEENRKLIQQWGREHAVVKVNVLGQFPPQGADKLLGPEQVMEAMSREADPRLFRQEPLIMGLDIGYAHDESVLVRRQGFQTWTPRIWRDQDLMVQADQVMQEVVAYRPQVIFADRGGPGAGLVSRLQQLGANVSPVDFGWAALEEERFHDRRSEMWHKMAEWVKAGGCLPNDPTMRQELLAPNLEWKTINKRTKFKLESKAEMKRRGLDSPDRADALALTFAAPVYSYGRPESASLLPGMVGVVEPLPMHMQGRLRGGTEDEWTPLGDEGGR